MTKRGQRATLRRSGRSATRARPRGLGVPPTILLAGAIVVSLGVLGGFLLSTVADRDWHAVASVSGVSISRAQLRSRIELDVFLARVRTESIRAAVQAGRLTADDAAAVKQRLVASEPVNQALDELIDEEVVRQGARTLGVSTPSADAGPELVAAAIVDARLHVRGVTLSAPAAPGPTPADPGVAEALRAGQLPGAIAATATAAGWTARGVDAWLPTDGPASIDTGTASDTRGPTAVPASLLIAARSGGPNSIIGPFTDEMTGDVTTGLLVEVASDGPSAASARQQAADSGIDVGALDAWAQAQALRRAVTEHLIASWAASPVDQMRAAELVLGPPPDGGNPGPFAELSHLVVKQIGLVPGGASPPPTAAGLAAELRALPLPDRLKRFASLVTLANASPSATALARSGEVGIVSKSGLLPALGGPAFASGARSGDILGPITTAEGDELFLLEARYSGALDDSTIAALIAARAPDADFATMAARIDPALVPRARSGPWRARPEFAAADAASSLLDVPVGIVSDPLVLDGQLIVARVLERRAVPAAGPVLDRMRLDGFAAWLADRRVGAAISREADPLGSANPSLQPSASGLPSIPADTPFLPSLPGRPGPPTANPLSFPVAP